MGIPPGCVILELLLAEVGERIHEQIGDGLGVTEDTHKHVGGGSRVLDRDGVRGDMDEAHEQASEGGHVERGDVDIEDRLVSEIDRYPSIHPDTSLQPQTVCVLFVEFFVCRLFIW